MSRFEKILAPFIDPALTKEDLSENAGFIGGFTSDPDRPSGNKEFFLVYDDNIRTQESISRAIKFDKSFNVVRKYVKYVNNKPYLVYSFWVKPELKNMYAGIFILSPEQKAQILQFWGLSEDITKEVLNNSVMSCEVYNPIPLADYRKNFLDKQTLVIQKRDVSQIG